MYLFASCDFYKSYDLLYMWYQASLEIFATPWTVARQAPLSMGFPRPEYWSGSSCPPPGYLPNPGIKPTSLTSPALAGRLFTTDPPGMPRGSGTGQSELIAQTWGPSGWEEI